MSASGRKLLIWLFALSLVPAAGLESQDSTVAVPDSTVPAISPDTSLAPAPAAADTAARVPVKAASQAPGADSVTVPPAGTPTQSPAIPVRPAAAGTAADSARAAPSPADTTAARKDTTALKADSLAGGAAADTLKKTAGTPAEAVKAKRPRPAGDEVEAEVIPWDWDDFTNVIAVGLKGLRNKREYELEKNEPYDTLFQKFRGQKVRAWGKVSRDPDGFYGMTVNEFEPLDSLAATSADSLASAGQDKARPQLDSLSAAPKDSLSAAPKDSLAKP